MERRYLKLRCRFPQWTNYKVSMPGNYKKVII
jgi:hypothetical protein